MCTSTISSKAFSTKALFCQVFKCAITVFKQPFLYAICPSTCIRVSVTRLVSSNSNSFYLSKNELEVSTKDKKYWIYIVMINQQRTKYIIKAIESPQFKNKSDFTLTPQEFRVTFSNCDNV